MVTKISKSMLALATTLSIVMAAVPIHSGADPDLPDEAFNQRNIAANDPFPHQAELAARVNFWRHVFGVWGDRQAALHDMSNPGLVYEVLTLPEGTRGADRKDFVNEHIEDLMQRLYNLEQKIALGKDLDDAEQSLLNKFRTLGKVSQLAGAHERVRVQYGIRDKFLKGVEVSGRYDNIFRRIFRSYGVPEDLAFLPHVESSFQTQARCGAGAVGIWQFTLPAARTFMKVNSAIDERYDPVLAAEGCARYLAAAYAKLGDWGLAITSYNHGVGGMSRAQSEFGNDMLRILEEYEGPQFGFDSRNFYVEFLAAREVAKHAERYFDKVYRERPQNWEKVSLDESKSIYQIARDYGVNLTELSEINTALSNSALKGRVSLPEGTSIWLPAGTQQRIASRSKDDDEVAVVERPIRMVRIPDPTQERVVAMVEDSLATTTKLDTPVITRNNLIARSKSDQNDDDQSENKIATIKVNLVSPKIINHQVKENNAAKEIKDLKNHSLVVKNKPTTIIDNAKTIDHGKSSTKVVALKTESATKNKTAIVTKHDEKVNAKHLNHDDISKIATKDTPVVNKLKNASKVATNKIEIAMATPIKMNANHRSETSLDSNKKTNATNKVDKITTATKVNTDKLVNDKTVNTKVKSVADNTANKKAEVVKSIVKPVAVTKTIAAPVVAKPTNKLVTVKTNGRKS